MNHSQCCHFNDTTCYHVESNDSLNHVNDGTHNYNGNVHLNGATFQHNQDLIQVSPSLSRTHWVSSEYYRQDNNHCPTPSNIYNPIADNTPPEEMLHALLREQNDEYCYPPYKNVVAGTPLSPMSMQSVDSFDTLSSPKFDYLTASPNSHTSEQCYVVNSSSAEDTYYQTFEHYHHMEQQGQFQLQLQYEFEQQQSVVNESIGRPQYDPMASHSLHARPSHHQPLHHQQGQGNNNRRRYDNSQHVAPHQHDTCSTNFSTSLVNIPHVFNDSKQVQPKRKRNTSRRTLPSQLICPTCSRKFTRPYNLKSHQRTHTKERPYICTRPGCTWTFARPHDLKRHDLLHSGIKKYVCSCGKPFARSDAFKRHQAVDKICSLRLKGNYM
ncbi:hypothetical protein INT48_009160 [Thamnidium elegans]|uniref:C2H2-type domain-containing protein n=1 Tax=Thamnidium elegans TaxID=101142 RepID=A0A8H7VWF7_9FUNG|nr:hypothetical protein INT48_009160 [Thamnidium elegans]